MLTYDWTKNGGQVRLTFAVCFNCAGVDVIDTKCCFSLTQHDIAKSGHPVFFPREWIGGNLRQVVLVHKVLK